MSNEFKNADFLDDKEKMRDFIYLTKEEFLSSYSYLTEDEYDNTYERVMEIQEKFDLICKSIPTWALSDEIGLDTETSYILDLTIRENYEIANEYLKETCFEDFVPIPDSYIGEKLIMEYDTNGGSNGNWYSIHGNIDQYFKAARATLERYIKEME